MRSIIAALLFMFGASAATAQIFPTPGASNPRIQSAPWTDGETIVLTALPETTLTVVLEPGETIVRATLDGSRLWEVSVPSERNNLQITPELGAAPSSLIVETDTRRYEFLLEAGQGLMAAYLVSLEYGPTILGTESANTEDITNLTWGYRLRGDRAVRPQSVRDNGVKTVITYAPGQPLPAVFAIGATGDEEVVDGYMRGDLFIIDRVHRELVFRIDRDRATAKRNRREDEEQ